MRNHTIQWWWGWWGVSTKEEIAEENKDNVNIEMQVDNWKVENE